jgi:uncharacterized metal-binding protein
MEAKAKCLCGSSDVRVVACSGASNVGQIANQVIITDLGIEKSHDIAIDEKACSIVVEKVREELSS